MSIKFRVNNKEFSLDTLKNAISIVKTFEGIYEITRAELTLSNSPIYVEYKACREYINLFNITVKSYRV